MVNPLEIIKAFIFNQNEAGWTENTLSNADMNWLIEQAETLRKIADTWVAIETNGTSEDADNFYTIVQDILSPPQDN